MRALSILATVEAELGSLDRIARIVRLFGMVNVRSGLQPDASGAGRCSDVLVDIFGDAGQRTRSAVGLAELPVDIAVEIEMTARLIPA